MLSNKLYDGLKWIALFLLPALATLYFALSGIWNLPYTEEIVGTIMAVDAFLGFILGLSASKFNANGGAPTIQTRTRSLQMEIPSVQPRETGVFIKLSGQTYDTLNWLAMFLLPALGALYFALAGIWGFPYGEQVVGTIAAIDVFLGVILGISSAQYKEEVASGRLILPG